MNPPVDPYDLRLALGLWRLTRAEAIAGGPEVYRAWKCAGCWMKEYAADAAELWEAVKEERKPCPVTRV